MTTQEKVNFTSELNEQQLAVVTSKPGPALVLAGAGSGKTRTLIYRVAWLIQNGFQKDRILLLTFTNKAAHEMLERAEAVLGDGGDGKKIWGGTFHHIANRLLRKYGKLIDLSNNFTILDAEDSRSLIKAALKEFDTGGGRRKPGPPICHDVISYSTNSGLSIEQSLTMKYPEYANDVGLVEKVAARYREKKRASNSLDFDDLLMYWLTLLRTEAYRKVICRHWDYILVDEYQDTNRVQDEICRLLAKDHNNILVVGDDAQSIYSFRAAQLKNILDFPKQFPDTAIFKLERNYRSTPEILEVANQVIEKNTRQFKKKLFTEERSESLPQVMVFQNGSEEAHWVAERIMELEDQGVALPNIAVLFRAAHLSQELELQLNKRRIPYEMRGGLKFFERAHIKDVLAHLKVVSNHMDEAAWRRLLLIQEGIGDVGAKQLIERVILRKNIEDALDADYKLSKKLEQGWADAVRALNRAVLKREGKVGDMIRGIAKEYARYVSTAYANYRERLDDIEQLALYADRHQNLESFLSETSLQENFSVRGEHERDEEAGVILSTVHQAKGLEWHTVFLINVSDKSFPHPRAIKDEGGIEEERRLFYVAITRAKRRLFFSYPISSSSYSLNINQPSDFLREIESGKLAGEKIVAEDDILDYGYSASSRDGELTYLPDIDSL